MSDVTLQDLVSKIHLAEGPSDDVVVRNVAQLRSLDVAEGLEPGTVVVLEPEFGVDVRSYRFDLLLRSLPPGTPAVVVLAADWGTPALTASRIAADRSIALGHLLPGEDAVSLAMFMQSLFSDAGQALAGAVDLAVSEAQRCVEIEAIPDMLSACAVHLGVGLGLADRPASADSLALRRAGIVHKYLDVDAGVSPILKGAAAQIARRIEDLYEADHEARALPAITRSELFNEILLSDAATGADAVNRLRRAEFPIDGSHLAVRVDCHDPLPPGSSLQAIARCQARIAEGFLESLGRLAGEWTQAGTANSILVVSTLERAHSDLVGASFLRAINAAIAQACEAYVGLRLHVGMGTPHLGAPGFRASVSEAATALRAAQARGKVNEVEQFDRLGLGRALVRWAELDGVRPVINQIMGPVLALPPSQRKDTLATLRAYLDCRQNIARTADVLHLHRNTVRYRLDRIASLLPVDMDDPDDRLLLELSCRVVDAELL